MSARRTQRRGRRRSSREVAAWLRMAVAVLAATGGILAASDGGHLTVTSGGPAGCVVFRASS